MPDEVEKRRGEPTVEIEGCYSDLVEGNYGKR
jgi:hypothetical protein